VHAGLYRPVSTLRSSRVAYRLLVLELAEHVDVKVGHVALHFAPQLAQQAPHHLRHRSTVELVLREGRGKGGRRGGRDWG